MVGLSDFMRGIGAGMTSYGGSYIELDREKKLAALKKEEWGAEREFKATENKADRDLQWEIANLPKGSASSRPKPSMTALGPDGENGYKEIDTAGDQWFVDPVTRERIPWEEYSKSRKAAEGDEKPTDVIPEDIREEANTFTNKFSTASADPTKGWDSQDYEAMPKAEDREEGRVAEMYGNILAAARNKGGKAAEEKARSFLSRGSKEEQLRRLSDRYYQITGGDPTSKVVTPTNTTTPEEVTTPTPDKTPTPVVDANKGLIEQAAGSIMQTEEAKKANEWANSGNSTASEWRASSIQKGKDEAFNEGLVAEYKALKSSQEKAQWRQKNMKLFKGERSHRYRQMVLK